MSAQARDLSLNDDAGRHAGVPFMTSTRNRILSAVLASAATIGLSDSVFAQHVGEHLSLIHI